MNKEELYAKYMAMGYTKEQIDEAFNEMQKEQSGLHATYNAVTQNRSTSPQQSNTLVAGSMNQDNLIKWQLELDSILERIEHILRGDRPSMVNGNMIFIPAENDHEKILNNEGVAEIMRILSNYLNRNTILSNYDEKTIDDKMLDFGEELNNLIFTKYQEMGMNTMDKRKRYPMIVREVVDIVHSSYLRALNGGERESLRKAMSISQSENIAQHGGVGNFTGVKERGILNPMRWIGGRYA